MHRAVLLAGVLVALESTARSDGGQGPVSRTFEADLVLAVVHGVCTPSEPARLDGAFGQTITWKIVNQGCGPQYVAIHRFKQKGGHAEGPSPINPAALAVGPIARGERYHAAATISKHVTAVEHYAYQICIGDTPKDAKQCIGGDPDLDVWPMG